MSSLKGYIPPLARILGTTPAALYERQRALVRGGLLTHMEGRGPGSGVRASSVSVATLLMSVLVTDKLTDSEERVRALAEACPLSGKCAFTGMPRFLRAFALLLTAKSKAALVSSITISRTADIATISYFDQNHELKQSSFYGKESNEHGIIVNSIFPGKMLHHISEDVLAIWREITTEQSDV